MTRTVGLTTTQMLAALHHLGARYDPDNVSTATSDDDGPGECCIAQRDLDTKADAEADRWERYQGSDV